MPRKLLHLVAALIVFAGLSPADEKAGCKIAGVIFTNDPLGGTMILKDGGGYLKNVKVSSATSISKLPVGGGADITPMRPAELNSGDLVCVHGSDGDAAQKLSVVTRKDVERAQTAFVETWQHSSLYGTLSSIDVGGRTIVVTPLPPAADKTPIRVAVPASARLRAVPPKVRRITESTSFRLEDLKVGEPVYLRGTRNGTEMTASLVFKGGYRGILGTIVEVKVFGSVLRLKELGTDRTLNMKMTPGEMYRTTENLTLPMRVETASGVVMAPVGLADIQAGDVVLVVGKTVGETSEGEGLVALTKFGTFGVMPQDPQNRLSWFIAK